MSLTTLDSLLLQIKEGDTSDKVLSLAQALLASEERLPSDLRAESLSDDPVATAVALLGLLGHDDGFGLALSEALAFELREDVLNDSPEVVYGRFGADSEYESLSVTADMVAEVESDGLPIVEAVLAESGHCEVVVDVMGTLGLSQNIPLALAIAELAGPIDVSSQVMDRLGFSRIPIIEAIQDEAGLIDVVVPVMKQVRQNAVFPGLVIAHPEPANSRWMYVSGLAVAAAALLSIVTLPMLREGDGGEELMASGFQFASASEIVVNDLIYDKEAFVQVIQDTDEQGGQALIIWIDDEAVL